MQSYHNGRKKKKRNDKEVDGMRKMSRNKDDNMKEK